MIYATMCVGTEWCDKHARYINGFGNHNEVHILTDKPSYFSNCITYQYNRDEFSYYEKINHVLELVSKFKQRVTYLDADTITNINTEYQYDSTTLYVHRIFDFSTPVIAKNFGPNEYDKVKEIFSKIGLDTIGTYYGGEAIISFPYREDIELIKKDNNILQPLFESFFNKIPPRETMKRYSDTGIGYGEGWAITAICLKYNMIIQEFDWRRKSYI